MITFSNLKLVSTFLISASSIPFIDYGYSFNILKLYFIGFCIFVDTIVIVFTSNFLYDSFFYHHIATLLSVYKSIGDTQCIHLCNHPMFLESSAFTSVLSRKYNYGKSLSKFYWCFDRLFRFPFAILLNNHCAHYYLPEISVLVFLSSYWSFEMLKLHYYKQLAFSYTLCFVVVFFLIPI